MKKKKDFKNTGKYEFLDSESYTSREVRKAQEARRAKRAFMQEKSEQRRRARALMQKRRRTVIGVLSLIAVLMIFAVGKSVLDLLSIRREKADAEETLRKLELEKKELEEKLELVHTDEYVEEQARSELKMIKDGEILYFYDASEDEKDASKEGGESSTEETNGKPGGSGKKKDNGDGGR